MNVGDRFINITTGTIIEVTEKKLLTIDTIVVNDIITIIQDEVITLSNITNRTKIKDITTKGLELLIQYSNGVIQPYNGEPIQPIKHIKKCETFMAT